MKLTSKAAKTQTPCNVLHDLQSVSDRAYLSDY